MTISSVALKKLFALSGNICAFPRCRLPIYDTDEDVITGQICHIKGKHSNGPRHDAAQTQSERDGYPNLILMCSTHNTIVDSNEVKYTVEVLTDYKRKHEARYQNTVVQPALLERFLNRFRSLLPSAPPWVVRFSITFIRTDETGADEYGLHVSLTNESTSAVDNSRLYVMFSRGYRVTPFTSSLKSVGLVNGQVGVLLQPPSLLPGESVGLRLLFYPPTRKQRDLHRHKLQLELRSGRTLIYRTRYSLEVLLEGLSAAAEV